MVAALQGANTRLREQNAELRAENAELKVQLAERAEKIARLERLISRNSANSSMPPSTDDLPGKRPPERRTGQGGVTRKPGKQPGAPGGVPGVERSPGRDDPAFPGGRLRLRR